MGTRAHRARRTGGEHPLALRPRRGQCAAAGERRRHSGQRPGRCGRCPPGPGLLPSGVPRPARRPVHRRRAAPRRAGPSARRCRLASRPHPRAHPRPPVPVATGRAAARGRRRAIRLRRRLGQPRTRRARRSRHRTRLPAPTGRPRPARAAALARADPRRPRGGVRHRTAPNASSTTRTERSGTAPGGSSPSP
jgi:hypothetical protein